MASWCSATMAAASAAAAAADHLLTVFEANWRAVWEQPLECLTAAIATALLKPLAVSSRT